MLRNWEQGRRAPDGPPRVLLAMLARNPRVVEEALRRSSSAPRSSPSRQRGGAGLGDLLVLV